MNLWALLVLALLAHTALADCDSSTLALALRQTLHLVGDPVAVRTNLEALKSNFDPKLTYFIGTIQGTSDVLYVKHDGSHKIDTFQVFYVKDGTVIQPMINEADGRYSFWGAVDVQFDDSSHLHLPRDPHQIPFVKIDGRGTFELNPIVSAPALRAGTYEAPKETPHLTLPTANSPPTTLDALTKNSREPPDYIVRLRGAGGTEKILVVAGTEDRSWGFSPTPIEIYYGTKDSLARLQPTESPRFREQTLKAYFPDGRLIRIDFSFEQSPFIFLESLPENEIIDVTHRGKVRRPGKKASPERLLASDQNVEPPANTRELLQTYKKSWDVWVRRRLQQKLRPFWNSPRAEGPRVVDLDLRSPDHASKILSLHKGDQVRFQTEKGAKTFTLGRFVGFDEWGMSFELASDPKRLIKIALPAPDNDARNNIAEIRGHFQKTGELEFPSAGRDIKKKGGRIAKVVERSDEYAILENNSATLNGGEFVEHFHPFMRFYELNSRNPGFYEEARARFGFERDQVDRIAGMWNALYDGPTHATGVGLDQCYFDSSRNQWVVYP